MGQQRLAKNIPTTLDNSRQFDSTSYLTADPASLRAAAERAAKASRKINDPEAATDEEDEEDEEDADDDDMPEAGPSTVRPKAQAKTDDDDDEDEEMAEGDEDEAEAGAEEEEVETQEPVYAPPPKIMITTSPSPCKLTYNFCDALKSVFPGGQFFKRPRGKGFELGRLARWGIKRGFGAVIIVNEDHKQPSELLNDLDT
jgi:ribosome production factor 1